MNKMTPVIYYDLSTTDFDTISFDTNTLYTL